MPATLYGHSSWRPLSTRGALTLCPQLCMGMSSMQYTEIGLLRVVASNDVCDRPNHAVAGFVLRV
jgi:hypothetical protein